MAAKKTSRRATIVAPKNLLNDLDLQLTDPTKNIQGNVQDLIETIQKTFLLNARTPHAVVSGESFFLNFLGAEKVLSNAIFASWSDGGKLKKDRQFKSKALNILIPSGQHVKVLLEVGDFFKSGEEGFFFIEEEVNNQPRLVKRIKPRANQNQQFISFEFSSSSGGNSKDIYISHRKESSSDSQYLFWSLRDVLVTLVD